MTFKVGETYTAVNGNRMTVRNHRGDGSFVAVQAGSPAIDQVHIMYEADGTPQGTGWEGWALTASSDRFIVGETYTRIKHGWRREGIDAIEFYYDLDPDLDVARLGPKKVNENITDRLDRIQAEMESGRRGLIYRMDKSDQRLAKMDEENALNLVATDARLDRLSGIINVQDQRIIALEDRCTNLGHKADGAHTRIGAFSNVLNEVQHALAKLETADMPSWAIKLKTVPGLATLNAAVVKLQDRVEAIDTARAWIDTFDMKQFVDAVNDRLDRFALEIATKANAEGVKGELADRATVSVDLRQVHNRLNRICNRIGVLPTAEECAAAGPIPIQPKPAIGRWINVFREESGSVVAGPITFATQWAADQAAKLDSGNRVACIQINEAFG